MKALLCSLILTAGAIADGGLEVGDRAEDARLMRRRVRVEKKSSPKSTGSLHLPSESVHSLAIYRGWQ
jgi:hypothetical protein